MVREAVELQIQILVRAGAQIIVLVHGEGVGRQAVVACTDGQIADRRIGHAGNGGGQEALAAPVGKELRLLFGGLAGLIGEEIVSCPAGLVGKAVGILGFGLVVVEHVAQHGVGLVGIRADAGQIQKLVCGVAVGLIVLRGLVVQDDVVAGLGVVDGLRVVVIVRIVGKLLDLVKALGCLVKADGVDLHQRHHAHGVRLKRCQHVVLAWRLALVERGQLARDGLFQLGVLRIRDGGPGQDDLVSGVGQGGLAVHGLIVLHGLRRGPDVGVGVIDRVEQLSGHLEIPVGVVAQEDHQILVVADGHDPAGGLGVGVALQGLGVDRAEGAAPRGVLCDPLGVDVLAGTQAQTHVAGSLGSAGGMLGHAAAVAADDALVKQILLDDAADDAALAVHPGPAEFEPGDDAVVIGIMAQLVALGGDELGGQMLAIVKDGAQLVHLLLADPSGLVAAVASGDAVFDKGEYGLGAVDLLEAGHPAGVPGQGEGNGVQVDGRDHKIQRAGGRKVGGVAPVCADLGIPLIHAQAIAGIEADKA